MKSPIATDNYWHFLLDRKVLQRAAHLVADDSRHDFHENALDRQIFTHYRDRLIADIISALSTNSYLPHPATPANIPKSEFSERPGSLLPYRDRIVVQAIVMLIAPIADEALSDSVWSWRVKDSVKGKLPDQIKTGLFKETDISDFPFLKRRTIKRYIDEFEPWYALWPEFDRVTVSALKDDGYKWMLVSDISGYFENIQLDILRDLLISTIPNANKTINLLMDHFRAWSRRTAEGAPTKRGIPQGNSVSSFLGNFFLKPVDDHFLFYFGDEVRYFRYMDDVRILAKTRIDAVNAGLSLERAIRSVQLNLQSSKTKLLPASEALREISDSRLDSLDILSRSVRDKVISKHDALTALGSIYISVGSWNGAKAIRSKPATGLNLRVLRRWAQIHYDLGSSAPADRILDEALANPDYKVTRELLKIGRRFPRKRGIARKASEFITEGRARFEHHEAELLRAIRYFHAVPDSLFDHALRNILADEADPYVRVQSGRLLARKVGTIDDTDKAVTACMRSPDVRVITAGVLLAASSSPLATANWLREFSRHTSPEVLRLTQYIRALRREEGPRDKLLGFVFRVEEISAQRVYDHAAFLRFMTTGDGDTSNALIRHCRTARKSRFSPPAYREFLQYLEDRATANLSWIARTSTTPDE